MKLLELIPSLQNHPLFSCVSSEVLYQYFNEDTMELQHASTETVICSPSSNQIGVGALVSGCAQVTSGSNHESVVLKTIFPGEIFGIANLYTENSPFPSIITAKNDCTFLKIRCDAFRSFVEEEASARRAYLSLLSKKIVYLNHKISIFTAGSAEKRVAFFLLENTDGYIWKAPYSMGMWADMLGIGRASLYRALDGLSEMNLIVRKEKQIQITDPNALKKFLNIEPSL